MRACRRATSVETSSGAGSARVSSDSWTMRPGVGSMESVTASMPAGAGCDSRSSSSSVRSTFGSRIGAGSCRLRRCRSRVTSRRRRCRTAAPRSRCSRRWHNGSSSRVSTNESGSRSAMGHSSSSDASKGSSSSAGTSGPVSSPRARRCQRMPSCPSRSERSAAGSAASSPSVRRPQRATTARLGLGARLARFGLLGARSRDSGLGVRDSAGRSRGLSDSDFARCFWLLASGFWLLASGF